MATEPEASTSKRINEIRQASIIVKWSGKEYPITDLTDQDTVAVLRHEIFKLTQVRPERQKLINLKYKGKVAPDDIKLCALELKPNFKLMMVGSTEAAIEVACQLPEEMAEVIDDFDVAEEEDLVEKSPVYLAKVQRRVREYKITEINPPREGKKLLVLDIDYTLFDHRSPAETASELMRPYLHEFLESAYEHYDIVIWSATGMRWIEEKMKLLGVSNNANYKIMFYLDSTAMISVYTIERGVVDVKPLGLIWGIYPQYSSKNTIMFDDIQRNFLMNPRSGLRVRPFRQAHLSRQTDKELLKLSKYLHDIAIHCDDFNTLSHRKWQQYDPNKPR
ncbi:PREDICTED: ubiquitin-like domain-containing CTD phosphatase 1 [Rhagoletis zephyria]|uniref:ubiquitin-like domain-containing CTD phosphatase 1 n=1 Tax=Rhagoletis zephyria TaxID=28612 RepID=UPI00081128C9|nr:PREDICTED: ubiquitin-like domain-containing CTD phosphatase 1 [Rhagoletis zephyria]XP_036323605.1 ubiquitin-like domain-containing CTD phosphatase 1 [Rhagoletis pomonella]